MLKIQAVEVSNGLDDPGCSFGGVVTGFTRRHRRIDSLVLVLAVVVPSLQSAQRPPWRDLTMRAHDLGYEYCSLSPHGCVLTVLGTLAGMLTCSNAIV